jgi:hypothetical protein
MIALPIRVAIWANAISPMRSAAPGMATSPVSHDRYLIEACADRHCLALAGSLKPRS